MPPALQAELLNYALYLEQKAQANPIPIPSTASNQRRKRLAEALAQAAALNPYGDIADPVGQLEQRQDRPLPGRNHAD